MVHLPKRKYPPFTLQKKIAQLEEYRTPIAEARAQMSTLQELINAENWVDTRTFIHGPLGELRQNMAIVARKLLPKDQKPAQQIARDLFGHFERIDAAAKDRNSVSAKNEFSEAIKDFDAYLNLVPSNS